jgi:hypothetical protein
VSITESYASGISALAQGQRPVFAHAPIDGCDGFECNHARGFFGQSSRCGITAG